jgi:predicted alpha/beta hydrolase family esterase
MLRTAILISLLTLLGACGESATESAESIKSSIDDMAAVAEQAAEVAEAAGVDTSWFYAGGSLNKASTLEAWRNASNTERLASAADLLKGGLDQLPMPSEAMELARTLESEVTRIAESGQEGYVADIIEPILSQLGG